MTQFAAKIEPLTGMIEEHIQDLDYRKIDDEIFAKLRLAWYRYKVLFFPSQVQDVFALRDFARRFGKLEQHVYAPAENADSLVPRTGLGGMQRGSRGNRKGPG